jgi:hypothetical protein
MSSPYIVLGTEHNRLDLEYARHKFGGEGIVPTMPFRAYKEFNSTILDVMSAAYDAVAREIGITGSDPRSSQLALKIVEMVRAGEDDRDSLIKKARAAFV